MHAVGQSIGNRRREFVGIVHFTHRRTEARRERRNLHPHRNSEYSFEVPRVSGLTLLQRGEDPGSVVVRNDDDEVGALFGGRDGKGVRVVPKGFIADERHTRSTTE